MNFAYSDFIEKIMSVINKIAPIKKIRAKKHTEDWFDGGEIIENILIRYKLFKKCKNSKLQVDKEIYNAATNKVQRLTIKRRECTMKKK